MRQNPALKALLLGTVGLLVFLTSGEARLQAAPIKLEVQLIWGTNDDRSPDPTHKPVEREVKAKLKELPLKWNHYFEVNQKAFEVAGSGVSKVPLSEKCALEVKSVGNSKLEIVLFGKGKETLRRTQTLAKGEVLVLGGNAPNATAWLIVLKRME